MYIKQYKELQFRSFNFYPLNPKQETPISFVYLFFHDAYVYIQGQGVVEYIDSLDDGVFEYEMVNVGIDKFNNLIYLFEGYLAYRSKPITPEIDLLFEQEKYVEFCRIGFLEYALMTKENFIHIIVSWDKIWNTKNISYNLLYLDDQDWYDVMPFDSQEAMEQFVADHTKIENIEK